MIEPTPTPEPQPPQPIWCIMPILGAPQYTDQAIDDVLHQSVPTTLLLINQGVDSTYRQHLEQIAEEYADRVFLWSHQPPLPSLSASWNRALRFVWEVGGEEALVVNNDLRLHPLTVVNLSTIRRGYDALFVSAVGVTETQFAEFQRLQHPHEVSEVVWDVPGECLTKGGPDYSCFLISKEGHECYPFDERFIPAFAEDLDSHRRFMLGGDGDKIFSINLPYLHYASQTLKSMAPAQREAIERQINTISRAYYEKKWGGPVNHERYTVPFEEDSARDGVTTPELQAAVQTTGDARWLVSPSTN